MLYRPLAKLRSTIHTHQGDYSMLVFQQRTEYLQRFNNDIQRLIKTGLVE